MDATTVYWVKQQRYKAKANTKTIEAPTKNWFFLATLIGQGCANTKTLDWTKPIQQN